MVWEIIREEIFPIYRNRGKIGKFLIILLIVLAPSIPIAIGTLFSDSIKHLINVKTGQIDEIQVWRTTPSNNLIETNFKNFNETQMPWNTKYYSFKLKNTHPLKILKIAVNIDIYPDAYTIISPESEVQIPPGGEKEIIFKVDFNRQGTFDFTIVAKDSDSDNVRGSSNWQDTIYKSQE